MKRKSTLFLLSAVVLLVMTTHLARAEGNRRIKVAGGMLLSANLYPAESGPISSSLSIDVRWERIPNGFTQARPGFRRNGFSAGGKEVAGGAFYFVDPRTHGTNSLSSDDASHMAGPPPKGLPENCYFIGLRYSFGSFCMDRFRRSVGAFLRSLRGGDSAWERPSIYFEFPDF
jgi:hypothetical protein